MLTLVDGGLEGPRHVPLERWLRSKRDFEARAWAVVGQAEFKRDRIPGALSAFARAVQDEPVFNGARHLRYGLLLQSAGCHAGAKREFYVTDQRNLRERARVALRTGP